VQDFEDKEYLAEVKAYGTQKYNYIVLESIKSPDLEWETVNYDNPATWGNWESEFKASGFSQGEINHILIGVSIANSFNQDKLDEAKKRFLASRLQSSLDSSKKDELSNMLSGVPVSVSN
jgi:hypothetical protein